MRQDIISRKSLVSIIVVTYNSSKTIVETLESMKQQTYSDLELIVSDDCSTDNTVEVCREWLRENSGRFARTQLVTSTNNTGIAPNFNRGLAAANGEWIKLFSGDDALLPYTIEKYVNYIRNKPEIKFLHSNIVSYVNSFEEENRCVPTDTARYRFNQRDITAKEQFDILLRICPVRAITAFIKKEVLDEVGNFDESCPLWEDRPMWIKITSKNIKLHYLDIISSKYRIRSSSVQRIGNKNKLYSNFDIIKNKIIIRDYLRYMPFPEKIVKAIPLYLSVAIDKLGLNKNKLLLRIINSSFSQPFLYLGEKINKKFY